jgi:hypothetical protein
MIRNRPLLLSVVAVTFCAIHVFSVRTARAQCVTCHDFSTSGSGWTSSPPPQCGQSCDFSDACLSNCSPGRPPKSFLETLHPGLFLQPENGHLFVSGVIEGSPADLAGIRPGNEILRINENRPGTSCSALTWSSKSETDSAYLLVRTGSDRREITLPLLPIGKLLDRAWALGDHSLYTRGSNQVYGSYIFGLTWARRETHIVITDVLRGSPAYKAGVLVGDTVLSVDNVPSEHASAAIMGQCAPSDHRSTLLLEISRGSGRKAIALRSNGLSRVFSEMARPDSLSYVTLPNIASR